MAKVRSDSLSSSTPAGSPSNSEKQDVSFLSGDTHKSNATAEATPSATPAAITLPTREVAAIITRTVFAIQDIFSLRLLAQQANPEAQYLLGFYYANSKGVKKNMQEAVYWFEKAAGQGHIGAQYHLSLCIEWHEKRAANGNTTAQGILGCLVQFRVLNDGKISDKAALECIMSAVQAYATIGHQIAFNAPIPATVPLPLVAPLAKEIGHLKDLLPKKGDPISQNRAEELARQFTLAYYRSQGRPAYANPPSQAPAAVPPSASPDKRHAEKNISPERFKRGRTDASTDPSALQCEARRIIFSNNSGSYLRK